MSQDKVRIAILSFAHMHAYSYAAAVTARPDAELVGIWDDDVVRGREAAAKYGSSFFPDLSRLSQLGVDAVIVTSENSEHRSLVVCAAGAGIRAILCEKPIATTLADATAMIEVCKSAGVLLGTAFPCRYSPSFDKLLSTVENADLGQILGIRATNHGVCPMGWFVDSEKSGGGAVIDHTVHVADLNRLLLRSEAVEVYAEMGNGMYHQSWEDSGFLTITYANGTFATLDSSWSRPKKSFSTWGDVTMEIVATGGVVQVDMFAQAMNHYSEKNSSHRMVGWGSDIDTGLITDFIAASRGERPSRLASGIDGLKALEVAIAAYESAATRAVISLA
jgi:UDP-N-acetylglucosamine 3-dehydrogenase